VQQDDAFLGAVAHGGGFEHRHQAHQRDVEAEDRVFATVDFVVEEPVVDDLLLVVDVLLGAVRDEHVVEPLMRSACDSGVVPHQVEVFLEGPRPVQVFVAFEVLERCNAFDEARHGVVSPYHAATGPMHSTPLFARCAPGLFWDNTLEPASIAVLSKESKPH
jgi:hypothetical protein